MRKDSKHGRKYKNLTIPRAIFYVLKNLDVDAYGREFFKSVVFIETKISDLVGQFMRKQKKIKNIGQLFPSPPTYFSKAVDIGGKQKETRGVYRQTRM